MKADRLRGRSAWRSCSASCRSVTLPEVAVSQHQHQPRDRAVECELKFRLPGPEGHRDLERLLSRMGAASEGVYEENNLRFEGPGKSTRGTSLRLRILDGGPTGILTAKGPATFVRGIKIREETEVTVMDAQATIDLLDALGFEVAFSYRKHRAIWRLGEVAVTLDTLDAGWFAEIEGPREALEQRARDLGLEPDQALKDSYSALSKQHIDQRG